MFDWLDVPALIRASEPIYEYPMVDRDPLPNWTFGTHDADRRRRPSHVSDRLNGASQAILDARVLGRELLRHGMSPAALESYEAERREATTRIVIANRGNGPDSVMQTVEERCGGEFDNVDDVLSPQERGTWLRPTSGWPAFGRRRVERAAADDPSRVTRAAQAQDYGARGATVGAAERRDCPCREETDDAPDRSPLEKSDHAEWRRLWTDYLTFYETTLPDHVYDTTWERLFTEGEFEPRGLVAASDGVS